MTPKEMRNERLAAKLIANLERRHITACYYPTPAEACRAASQMIPDGSSVGWGGSMTIRDMGLLNALRQRGTLRLIDREQAQSPDEVRRLYLQMMDADVFLTSANAISENGVIVNIDGNGNRVAAITWGPKKVLHIIGLNKVAPNVQSAVERARHTAAPINAARFDITTPCQLTGQCGNCTSPDSICSYISLLRNCRNAGRHTVVLVGEDLGY